MRDEDVAHYLIEQGYHLTALELFTEIFERKGVAIEELSDFFEDSANFLMFEDMRSVSEISSSISESNNVSNDAIRIKDDRIAVLEHEIKVLSDKLDEAEHEIENSKNIVLLQSPPTNFSGPADDSEDLVLNSLIQKYLQTRGYKLSSLAFGNETSSSKQADRVKIPQDVDIVHLLRSFLFVQNSPQLTEEVEKLRMEKNQTKTVISQLTMDLEHAKKQIAEMTEALNRKSNEQESINSNIVQTLKVEPPSVALLDSLFKDLPSLVNAINVDNRGKLIRTIKTIIHYHPERSVRIECYATLFSLYDNPNSNQITEIISSLLSSKPDSLKIETEILPIVTQFLGSSKIGMLLLVSAFVSAFAPWCSIELRSSFLLSIIKQLSEHNNPSVRAAASVDGAKLIKTFDVSSNDKVQDLMDLCKALVFDSDPQVQSTALNDYVIALLEYTLSLHIVGSTFFEYWLKLSFSFGLTGSSSLAAIRFKACMKVLESGLLFLVPTSPKSGQQLIPNDSSTVSNDVVVPINKDEYNWIQTHLIPQIPKFASLLFVQIGIKKEADRFVAQFCKQIGQQLCNESVLPLLLKIIEEKEGDTKLQALSLTISAIIPYCGDEVFMSNSRNFVNYATNEIRGLKTRDIQDFIAPAFSLITSRDAKLRTIVFKLIEELAKGTRASIRMVALTILSEILPTLEQNEIASNSLIIVSRLASDPDETLLLEVINCVGSIARFSTQFDVLKTVRQLFDEWFRGRIPIRLQALRVFAVIINDVDLQFRDSYILPKLLECSNDTPQWKEMGSREQAMMLILHILHSVEEIPESVINSCCVPLLQSLSSCDLTAQDPKLIELKQRYKA